eukprot:787462-Pleurochrysis_carterae.AAC.1
MQTASGHKQTVAQSRKQTRCLYAIAIFMSTSSSTAMTEIVGFSLQLSLTQSQVDMASIAALPNLPSAICTTVSQEND